jgi:hypothetical protein
MVRSSPTRETKKQIMLPGCGHWTQQERATEAFFASSDIVEPLCIISLGDPFNQAPTWMEVQRCLRPGGQCCTAFS